MESAVFLSIIILIFSVVIHEVAHGAMANRLGDPTAKFAGRLTLNPIPHLDLFGSIIVPGLLLISSSPFLFGWAKPVPYNPYNLQGKFAELKVAIVGPISNIILALLFAGLIRLDLVPQMGELFLYGVIINCALAIFNMIPIPPLDGSKVLFELLPNRAYAIQESLERSGFILVLIFIFFGWQYLSPVIMHLTQFLIGA